MNKPENAIFEFVLLWDGWELDSTGWIVEENGERSIVLTDHGMKYDAQPQELLDKISEYHKVIADTHRALALLEADK